MIRVTIDGIAAIHDNFKRIDAALNKTAITRTAQDVAEYVRNESDKHTKTGALVQSVYQKRIDGGFEIGHDLQRAPHAVFVHWGTKPHVIKPKTKKALRWSSGGAFFFAKEINHPGNKPDQWMKRAADMAPRMFERQVNELLKKA